MSIHYPMFSAFLGLSSDWFISSMGEDKTTGLLEVQIKRKSSDLFPCPICNEINSQTNTKNYRRLISNKFNVRFYVLVNALHIECRNCGCSYLIDPLIQKK